MYDDLITALEATDIPFRECEWRTRPEGDFGTYGIDFETDADSGDNLKIDRCWEGSVDLFLHSPDSTKVTAVESAIESVCGACWQLSSRQYEHETGLIHYEWTFRIEEL